MQKGSVCLEINLKCLVKTVFLLRAFRVYQDTPRRVPTHQAINLIPVQHPA